MPASGSEEWCPEIQRASLTTSLGNPERGDVAGGVQLVSSMAVFHFGS